MHKAEGMVMDKEVLIWSFGSLIVLTALFTTLFRANDKISIRLLFVSYEGSLVALWPLATIVLLVCASFGHSII